MILEMLLRLLVSIHKKEPISGNILALGKQTIAVPPQKILEIFEENQCEVNPNFDIKKAKKDCDTRVRNDHSIDDQDFFSLFGDVQYQTMDISSYENATVIHDLNHPIPHALEGKFDFILDGGTFDHLFDVKTAFANVVKLLKPGGRIFQWNAASNYANAGYISFSADYFYDYYILNKFTECRTFFAESPSIGAQNWCVYEFIPSETNQPYNYFRPSNFHVMTLVYAKKGMHSTHNRVPVQLQYRDAKLRKEYVDSREISSASAKFSIKPVKKKLLDIPKKVLKEYEKLPKPDPSCYPCIGWL